MSEWQPIETAPRNGNVVLCCARDWVRPHFLRWYEDHPRVHQSGWEDAEELDTYWEYNVIEGKKSSGESAPSHWLPLPPFPTSEL